MIPFEDHDSNDDESLAQREAFDRDSLALRARWDDCDFESTLRKMGIYVDQNMIAPIPAPDGLHVGLVVQARVNRSAFTERVLDPEAAAMETQFKAIEVSAKDDDFLDERARIAKNIAEGRDPLDDGDDD